VIHLVTRLPLSYQLTLCRALDDAYSGAFCGWFATRTSEEFPYRAADGDLFTRYYLSEVGYWKFFKELQADPEAVIILGGWSSPMTSRTLLIATLLRIPVSVWADHPHPRRRSWVAASSRKLYLRFLARLVSGFLACGNPTIEHLVTLGIDRKRITGFPYWVEIPPEWSFPKRCRDEDAAQRPFRLVAVGRHHPVKQFEVAIAATALANQSAGRELAELVSIGDGPERAKLEECAKTSGCESSVSFTGWREIDEVYQELAAADALVLTSKFDAFGVVVLEAMAAGRPVLASEGVVAARDRDEQTGGVMLHPVGDAGYLAEQIISLATDNEKLRQASLAARATAERWPPTRAAAIVDTVLERTARGRLLLERTKRGAPGARLMDETRHDQENLKTIAAAGGLRR
jgi:glycosyltransferase involved in cell wall biosynthesis